MSNSAADISVQEQFQLQRTQSADTLRLPIWPDFFKEKGLYLTIEAAFPRRLRATVPCGANPWTMS
jgi:hypothetical protein